MRNTGDYHLSSDILQESFTRYLEKYSEETLSATLLYTIARRVLIDNYRKHKHDVKLNTEPGNPQINPERHFMVREDYRSVSAEHEHGISSQKENRLLVSAHP